MGVARQEHSMTRWKGAPHNLRLLKTARLGTGEGQGTDSWLGRQGQCRQLDRGFPTAFPGGGAARGKEAEEKACPSLPDTHPYTHMYTHTHRFRLVKTHSHYTLTCSQPILKHTHTDTYCHTHTLTHTHTETPIFTHTHAH